VKGVKMRLASALTVCLLAFLLGCSSPPSKPKDPKLLAREAYLNALADGCEKDAALLREQAAAYALKAREKDLKAREYRMKAREAAEGKVVEPDDSSEEHR
jgi:hypothetical protein